MTVQRPSSDAKNTQVGFKCIRSERVSRQNSGEYHIDIRGLRLLSGRYAIDLLGWSLPSGKRSLAVILPKTEHNARFEIGEVQIEETSATLVLFGPQEFEAQTLVF